MCRSKSGSTTAIIMVAVIFAALLFSGCATKRDVEEIKSRLSRVEENSRQTHEMVARMDSNIAAGAESNRSLQNDIRYSTDELSQQMSQLLENYNDLLARIDQLSHPASEEFSRSANGPNPIRTRW